jgi:hypothetical protein
VYIGGVEKATKGRKEKEKEMYEIIHVNGSSLGLYSDKDDAISTALGSMVADEVCETITDEDGYVVGHADPVWTRDDGIIELVEEEDEEEDEEDEEDGES